MQNAQWGHSAILLTFIKLPFIIKIFVLSIFEWPFYTGFTVLKLGSYWTECDCLRYISFPCGAMGWYVVSTVIVEFSGHAHLFSCFSFKCLAIIKQRYMVKLLLFSKNSKR